ncbi:C-type lectin 37Da-like [Malaya genurostris]|uniref:C-type lectin 37Da-like n=1 Tax=Malaya genurostris TaxID=325434 RepID=UPI0026F3E4E0|nr:C-type lectin 37Da-like [Malaya genurostris]
MKKVIILFILAHLVLGAKRYCIPDIKANWFKAHEFCTTLGMELISIESQAEHNALIKFIRSTDKFSNATRFWIGASDLAEEGIYTWISSGRLVTFTNWAANEPNNINNTEHCIEIIHNIYINQVWQWNDMECRNEIAYFVCESEDIQCVDNF